MEIKIMILSKNWEDAESMHNCADQHIDKEIVKRVDNLINSFKSRAEKGYYYAHYAVTGGERKEVYLGVQEILRSLGYEVKGDCDEGTHTRYWDFRW